MGELLERLRTLVSGRSTRLSRARALVLAILGSACLVSAGVVVVSTARTGGYRLLVERRPGTSAQSLDTLLELLEEEGVPWRSRSSADGGIRIEVRGEEAFGRAVILAEEHGLLDQSSTLGWIFKGNAFTDTPERFRARLDESRVREIEGSICWNPRVLSANVVLNVKRRALFALEEDDEGSATVALKLKPSVDRLSARETAAIRDMVSGAFNVPAEAIRITDNRGHSYAPSSSSGVLDGGEDLVGSIQDVVERLYLAQYRPCEFRVGVLVGLSRRASSVETVEVARGSPGSSPSLSDEAGPGGPFEAADRTSGRLVGSAWREEPGASGERGDGDATAFSRSLVRTEVPAGELRQVRVNVMLDVEAVRRVLELRERVVDGVNEPARGSFREELARYTREEEEFVKSQLPVPDARVRVRAEVFAPAADTPSGRGSDAARGVASLSLPVGERETESDVLPVLFVAGGALFLAGALWWWLRALSGSPSVGRGGRARGGPRAAGCEATLRAAASASELARNRPDLAAAVLKLWIRHEDDRVRENSTGSVTQSAAGNGTRRRPAARPFREESGATP